MSWQHKKRTWLIVGCGYVGQMIGRHALASGAADAVVGVRQSLRPPTTPWPGFARDITQPGWMNGMPTESYACVVFCAAPKARDISSYRKVYVEGLQHLITQLSERQTQKPRLIMTSSTGVFDEDAGGWVDEQTCTPASSERIAILLRAEELVHGFDLSGCVIRFGGIYGPGRERLKQKAQLRPLPLRLDVHYTNHIHRDDCARSVVHVANLAQPARIYVASDTDPTDYNALLRRLAGASYVEKQGLPPPDASVVTGKRCSSALLQKSGFSFAYPRYDVQDAQVMEHVGPGCSGF